MGTWAMTTTGAVLPRRATGLFLVVALTVAVAACGGDGEPTIGAAPETSGPVMTADDGASQDDPADDGAGTVTTATETTSAPSTSSTSTTTSDGEPVDDGATASPDELRRWLGAEHLVVRRDGAPVLVTSEVGERELLDEFPTVRGRYLVDAGVIIDVTGAEVCPDFELVGDFHVVADIEPGAGDTPTVIVEDRRALATDAGSGSAAVPRWSFDCATGTTTDLTPTTAVAYLSEGIQVTKAVADDLVLVETWGLGDTPLTLATGAGAVLLSTDQLAYDYVLSADQTTLYATAYTGTGAASPPAAVLAVDVATGEIRWRRDLGGFAWALGDQVLIEVVDPRPGNPGQSPGREIVLVDPATGEDLDRIRFTDRIVGLS